MHSIKVLCAIGLTSLAIQSKAQGLTFTNPVNEFNATSLIVPEGYQVDVIYQARKDSVRTEDGLLHLSKSKIDFLAFIPDENQDNRGILFMNHELRDSNFVLGHGGGMSWVAVSQKEDGSWSTDGDAHYIDFSSVGGTWHNCGGEVTNHNTILTAEEYPPFTNTSLYGSEGQYYLDTSDFGGMRRNEVMGWMVEVDIQSKKPLRKLWQMGRYSHEDTYCTPDGKLVYLTDDYGGGVFFKFEAADPGDYQEGQLYAYKQGINGQGGEWLPLPMEIDSLIHARHVAHRMGATLFKSHEWIDAHNGKLYIAESGGSRDYSEDIARGGSLAHHLQQEPLYIGHNTTFDPYGRILVFDMATNQMDVFFEGGPLGDGSVFKQPDGLEIETINGQPYVFVCEDYGASSLVDIKQESWKEGTAYDELYAIPITADGTAHREGIKRMAIGPEGCELTGIAFTPDKKTMFLTVQHPSANNPAPFNTGTVVAITPSN